MEQLIAAYLFQNKTCPLPGLGTLQLLPGKAEGDFLNSVIMPPAPVIQLDAKETDASNLLDFIAAKKTQTVMQAIDVLGSFCNTLKAATLSQQSAPLNGIGDFYTDGKGVIQFRAKNIAAAFLQPVRAERVIHPQAEHAILVGDKETTNTVMTEFYGDTPVQKDRWWVWAIILAAIALILLFIYLLNNASLVSSAGNAMPV
ncbi:MAG: hypothetical protein JST86_20820 [Bacteroidetes bacterium]|nr:hypothetical protein [Bacteroidota bacterium]